LDHLGSEEITSYRVRSGDDLASTIIRGRPRPNAKEFGWAVGLKYTEGFTRLWPTVATVSAMAVSLALLGVAVRTLPPGTAYAVWTGIGTVGTVFAGMWLSGEPASLVRLLCAFLIIAGIIGLKLITPQ
jgi:quaternary ammonium compound-resistance protein SugE